jgi:hypothetical protein
MSLFVDNPILMKNSQTTGLTRKASRRSKRFAARRDTISNPHSAPPSLQEVISPSPQQAHRGLMMGGQVQHQGPVLQLHQAHSDEEVEGPGGPGRRASGRVGPSPQNPKAWGEECGMLVVTSPETFCQGPHAGASHHGVVLDSSAPFWGRLRRGTQPASESRTTV